MKLSPRSLVLIGIALAVLILVIGMAGASPSGLYQLLPAGRNAAPSLGLPPIPAAAPTAAPAATSAPAAIAEGGAPRGKAADNVPALDASRLIVYTGSLSLQVQKTEDAVAKITDILKANQGYIASRSLVSDSKGVTHGTITIRVPAAALDSVIAQIKAVARQVLRDDSNSNDVTEEYTDLDARRKNLEAAEVELTKLLETVRESTGKAEDILAVYNQLTEIRGQIEQIKGRQNYLQNTSTLATYTIELVPFVADVPVEGKEDWNPARTASAALSSLVKALQGLADVGIFIVLYVLPILLVIVLPFLVLFLIARRLWRGRTTKKVVTT